MKPVYVLFVLLWSFTSVPAQQPAYFTIGKEQFEGVQIYGVIQDKSKNYWFATDQGFYKYNSHTFEKIACEGMKGLSAFGFVINKTGTIFCHNLNHQILRIENDRCSVFYELSEAERCSDMSLAISEENHLVVVARMPIIFDADGKMIGSYKNHSSAYGFPFHTKKGAIIYHAWGKDSLLEVYKNTITLKPLKWQSKQQRGPLSFFRIQDETYAISNEDKLLYAFDEDSYEFVQLDEQPFIQSSEFLRFYNVNQQLWIAGATAGVQTLEGKNRRTLSAKLYPDFFISSVFKDHEGNILLSTFNQGNLVIPDLDIEDVVTIPQKQSIVSVHADKDLGIVLGSSEGDLISFRDTKFQALSNEGKKPLKSINSWPGFPYVIYDDGKVKAYHKASGRIIPLLENSLKDAALLDTNTIYLALNGGIRKLRHLGSGVFQSEVLEALRIRTYAVEVEAVTRNVFAATSDGLRIIKPDSTIERPVFEGVNPFANDLFSDGSTLYVATKTNGILFFKNGTVIRKLLPTFNQQDVEIHKLVVYGDKIYASSSRGFIVLSMDGVVQARLNKAQGFSTNRIFDFDIAGDQVWIIHARGFQKLNIHQLNDTKEKPLLELSAITVNDSTIQEVQAKGMFNSEQRKVQFTISSPTLRNKENIRYHYMLKGYDKHWIVAGYEDNKITYNALAPGEYTFMVKAENQGVYSATKTYSFSISAPFYFRWWFIVCEFVAFFLFVAFIYRWQLHLQRKKSEQQNELNASKLIAIQSQMNPHFIFNALNSIQDLILKGDVENSYSYITTFSNMVRKTLKYSEREFIDVDQELKLLELYLSLEKLRFKKDLEYRIITSTAEELMIPPLLIQPFVENALVHGLLHKEGKKELSISLKMGEVCTCIIEDNGIGREKAKLIKQRQRAVHESFSGRAIQKRFEILSKTLGGNFGYAYEDLYEGHEAVGTRVTLRIPIKRTF